MKPLSQHIKQTYGSVYRAVKETGIADTQLRRWIKAGALIDKDGQVWIKSKGRLPVNGEQVLSVRLEKMEEGK